MQPMTPVIPGVDAPITEFAKDQSEYQTLPAWVSPEGTVVTRWRMGWRERFRVLLTGDLWLSVLTFNQPLQPVKLGTQCPVE
jgi:hypothetical protein